MKSRCKPDFGQAHDYHDRGITVCAEWLNNYPAFLAEVGLRPEGDYSLDRIDNDVGYRPGNVRWASRKEQSINKRCSIYVELAGERLPLKEAAKYVGLVSYNTAWHRIIKQGWDPLKAITTPPARIGMGARR